LIGALSAKYDDSFVRLILGDDPPSGTYYFDHRHRPIDTQQYGNITFDINPSAVTSSASVVLLGLEALGIRNLITQAGSLMLIGLGKESGVRRAREIDG
jgi:hypothetical protein